MKKLIFEYLNVNHPNIYLLRTKFGDDICCYGDGTSWLYVRREAVNTIKDLFCCNFITADDLVNEWIYSRPVFKRITNATNETVLVPVLTESETSTLYV